MCGKNHRLLLELVLWLMVIQLSFVAHAVPRSNRQDKGTTHKWRKRMFFGDLLFTVLGAIWACEMFQLAEKDHSRENILFMISRVTVPCALYYGLCKMPFSEDARLNDDEPGEKRLNALDDISPGKNSYCELVTISLDCFCCVCL